MASPVGELNLVPLPSPTAPSSASVLTPAHWQWEWSLVSRIWVRFPNVHWFVFIVGWLGFFFVCGFVFLSFLNILFVHIYTYLYAIPRDIGKCASVGEEWESPGQGQSQEHPSPAGADPGRGRPSLTVAPRLRQLLPSRLRRLPSPSPPRRARDVTPSRSETDSSALAWTGRCSGSSSGAQPESPLFSGGLWKTDRQRDISGQPC